MNQQSTLTGWIVGGLVSLLVIAINVSLFSALRRKGKTAPGTAPRALWEIARAPWQDEDRDLVELDRLVQPLQPAASASTDEKPQRDTERS